MRKILNTSFKYYKNRCPVPGTTDKWWRADGFNGWHLFIPQYIPRSKWSSGPAILAAGEQMASAVMAAKLPNARIQLHSRIQWLGPQRLHQGGYPYVHWSVYLEDQNEFVMLKLLDSAV